MLELRQGDGQGDSVSDGQLHGPPHREDGNHARGHALQEAMDPAELGADGETIDEDAHACRNVLARGLFTVALALICFALLLTIATWYVAKQDGRWPVPNAEHWMSNHGPWRHYRQGIVLVESITLTLFLGSIAALVSILAKPRLQTAVLLVVGVIGFWEAFGWFFYLGD